MSNIFVYGTLLDCSSYLSNFIEQSSYFSVDAVFRGKMYSCHAFPFVIPSTDSNDIVYGKTFSLTDDKIFDILDEYEGYDKNSKNNFYTREQVNVVDKNLNIIQSWIYIVKAPIINNFERIESGDWLEYYNKKTYRENLQKIYIMK